LLKGIAYCVPCTVKYPMIRGRKSEKLYLSALAHTLAGSTVCVSIICCCSVSWSCTMSGRSPLARPALYLEKVWT
jgi:hypothetical protein